MRSRFTGRPSVLVLVSLLCFGPTAMSGCGRPASIPPDIAGVDGRLPASLAGRDRPRLEVALAGSGRSAEYHLRGERAGVREWRATGPLGIQTRSGILIGTRGYGLDLLSASTEGLETALAGGPATYTRLFRVMTGDGSTLLLQLYCRLATRGGNRFTETCEVGDQGFVNEYETGRGGEILRSVQWAGPAATLHLQTFP